MKILVTGKNGQVAQAMLACAKDDIEVIALGRPELDITNKTSVEQVVTTYKPDIIVNAAAYTAVDKAEEEVATAFAVNRDGAMNVAKVTANHGLPIIHISTDYVFNGEKDTPYTEEDATGPLSVYGLSKLEGEWAVQEANPNHVILRTAWIYSPYGSNFVKTMLRLAETRDEISVVSDQWGTPTSADFIADNIIKISGQILSTTPPKNWRGIFHLVPDGKTNWAEFAEKIFTHLEKNNGKVAKVKYIKSLCYKTRARRPKKMLLCNNKFKSNYKIDFQKWDCYFKSFFCINYPMGF